MVIECLECNYKCETPFTLSFHHKLDDKDKLVSVHVEMNH